MSKPNNFQIRNRLRESEGTYSKGEILKRISAGKYTGDEEIAAAPFDRWQKLSSHPVFYDAFLKRLFHEEYHPPDEPVEQAQEQKDPTNLSRATRQGEGGRTRAAAKEGERDDGGKTRQLRDERIANATIHQSVIDELFSDAGSNRSARPEPQAEAGGGTDLLKIEGPGPSPEATLPVILPDLPTDRPLDVAAPGEPELEPMAAPKPKKSRRKLLYGSALALMLVMLFQMGKTDLPPVDPRPPFVLFASSAPPLPAGASKADKVKTLVEEGDALAFFDTPLAYFGAIEAYRDALSYDENNAQILGKLTASAVRILTEVPNTDALVSDIQRAIARARAVDPHYSQLYRVEAISAVMRKNLDEARRAAVAANEADPANPENALVIGEVHLALGEPQSARGALEEGVKALPGNVRARYLLARSAFEMKDATKAKSEALEALKLSPLHAPSFQLLADLAVEGGQLKEARGLYETAGRLARFTTRDQAARAFFRLGGLQADAGDQAGSRASFRLAYHYWPQVDPGLAEKVKALDTKKASLEKLASESEYTKDYFTEQGEALLKQGNYNEAVKFFQAARLLDPKDGAALVRLGEVTEKTAASYEDFRRIISLYERAIERDRSLAKAYIKLGMLETEQYNLDRGYKLLTQAVALAPKEADPYVALGKHFYKRQDYNEALTQFLKAANINNADSEILYYAGLLRLMFKKDGARDAMRFFYQAYTYDSTNYDALVEWLKLKVAGYEKNFAIKFVRTLLDADPNNAQLHWALGEVYSANKEFRRGIGYYHKSLDLDNRASKVRMSLAKALESVGELDKSVAEYRLASLLDRRNSDGFYRAADLLFQMRNYANAEEVLKFLVNVTPNYPGAHRYLSKVFQVRGQRDPAVAAMKKEVDNNPQNYKFIVELAELYMEYEKFDLAIQELTRISNLPSIAKAPEFVYDKIRAFLLLSRSYRAQNKPENAESAIKLALEIDSRDPELYRELGYVYFQLQRDKEGVRAFEYYLREKPSAADADTIKGLIQQMIIEE